MLLKCSSCGTRFLVDPTALGLGGRIVRCGHCFNDWFQAPPDDPPPATEPAPPPPPAAEYKPVANLPAIHPPDSPSRAPTIWLLVVVLVALVIGGGTYGRHQVMRLWPSSVPIYQRLAVAIGAPLGVADSALTMTNIRARSAMSGDRPVVVVEGDLANPTGRTIALPRLRVVLLDPTGAKVGEAVFRAVKRQLVPGEELPFRTYIADPPPDAADVSVYFVEE